MDDKDGEYYGPPYRLSDLCTSFKRANMPRFMAGLSAFCLVSLRPRKSSLAASSLHAKPTPRAWLNFGYWHKVDMVEGAREVRKWHFSDSEAPQCNGGS